jgi:hypothetical protein
MPPAPFFVAYKGRSMHPTLIEPELLEVVPYEGSLVRMGDVVFFVQAGGDAQIVHRVVRFTPQGLVTRGDNSSREDDRVCPLAEVRGRVVAAWRGQRQRVIYGGRLGRLWASTLYVLHLLLVAGVRLLSRPYHALARSGFLRPMVPTSLRPRVLAFQQEGALQYRLVMGRHTVGEYDLARQVWQIRPPYLLFTDEASLPPEGTRRQPRDPDGV